MNILITGGSGFIGSHIADKAINAGHNIRILDLKSPHRDGVDFVEGSFMDDLVLEKAIAGMDAVFHIGGFSNIDKVKGDPVGAVELNILGTAKLLNVCRKNNVKRFLFASSVFVEGEEGHIYTTSKKASEALCRDFHTLYGLPYTILRFGTAYGPRSRMEDVISRFVKTAKEENKIIVYGTGSQTRNFIFVEDLAEGAIAALCDGAENKTFPLASPKATEVIEVAETVKRAIGGKPEIVFQNQERTDDYQGSVSGLENAYQALSWRPRTSLEDGIKKFIDSIK